MSTSPSWFDQDKFSRLVKKVGQKTVPVPMAGQPATSQPLPEKAPEKPAPEPEASPSVLETEPDEIVSQEAPAPIAAKPESEFVWPEAKKVSVPPQSAATPSLPLPGKSMSPPLPGRVPNKSMGMMTSQSVSLSKIHATPPPSVPAETPQPEPIRGPESPKASLAPNAPPLITESRALPRRTSELPALKSVFQFEIAGTPSDAAVSKSEATGAPTAKPEMPAINEATFASLEEELKKHASAKDTDTKHLVSKAAQAQANEDLSAAWEKITQLTNDLTQASKERDQAINENVLLREQLDQADQASGQSEEQAAELSRITQERDEALSESNDLREQLRQANEAASENAAQAQNAQLEELDQAREERDQIRRDYVELREQFENVKQELVRTKGELGEGRADLEKQVETLRAQVAEKDLELKAAQGNSVSSAEMDGLKAELGRAKDEASVAQRGLALSQKALQETRDALREASEGAGSKATLDNLKKENSTLVQQNMLLQAQHDQVARDLSAAKAKLAAKS